MTITRSSTSTVTFDARASWLLSTRTPDAGSAIRNNGATLTVGDTSTGDKTSNWRQKIRRHQNASSGFSASKTSHTGGYGMEYASFYDYRSIDGKTVAVKQHEVETGPLIKASIPSFPAHPDSLENEARAKLYKSAARAMTAFRSLTALGEMRETLRMIRNPFKTLIQREIPRHFERVLKRTRRVKRSSDRKRLIRDTYLETTFGWTPLLSDIRAGASALERRLERYQGSYTRVSGQADSILQWYNTGYSNNGYVLKRHWDYSSVAKKSFRYYGEVRSVNPNPVLADMRLLGITWSDVVLTGWELIPGSFLLDYASNIGDVLESWSIRRCDWAWLTSVSRNFVRTQSTNHKSSDGRITSWAGYVPALGHTHTFTCSPARATRKEVGRSSPLSGPGELEFTLEVPGISSRKWLNIAALVRGHRNAMRTVSRS